MHVIMVFLLLIFCAPLQGATGTLNVRDAVIKGFASHPKVQAAQAVLREAKGERLSALSPEAPTLAAEYEGVPRDGTLSQYGERRIAVSQGLDFPLKYVWRSSSANASVAVSRQQAIGQLLDLETVIRSTYADAWALSEKIRILGDNVEVARLYSSQLDRKVELGEAVPLEARRARVEYLQAKTQLDAAISEEVAVRARLSRLIGTDTTALSLDSPLGAEWVQDSPDTGLTQNPDLRAAGYEAERAMSELTLARAGWLPDLELSYFQQKAPTEQNPNFWGVEAGLSLPVWFWLGGRGEIESAVARRIFASSNLANLRLEIASERDRLVQAVNKLGERYRLYQSDVVPAATEAYDLAMKSFRLGEANYLQVLDAQRSALETQIEYIEIQGELYRSIVELDRLAGQSILGTEEIQKLLDKGN